MIVVGAGAAGLAAAAEAAGAGARTLVLEKSAKPGLKILISGGGHCNVTTTLGPREAEGEFGREAGRFLRSAIRETPPRVIRAWLHEQGVETIEGEFEKVWPKSMRARDVLDALLARAEAVGAELRTSSPVRAIERVDQAGAARADASARSARWIVKLADHALATRSLVLACGGLSYPKTGTTGDGYRWLSEIGCRLVEPRPALAPLGSPAPWVHELAGVTLERVEVQLREASGRIVYRRRRPLLFTHRGVSGPGPMDVSGRIEREPGRYRLHVDLLPTLADEYGGDEAAAQAAMRERLFDKSGSLAVRVAREGIPRRLAASLVERLGLEDVPPAQVPREARRQLIEQIRGLEIPISASLGFDQAEVTAGGVALEQVEPKTMELRDSTGLYVCGELLDADGPIGGFSFLQAFATGALAGRSAARAST